MFQPQVMMRYNHYGFPLKELQINVVLVLDGADEFGNAIVNANQSIAA